MSVDSKFATYLIAGGLLRDQCDCPDDARNMWKYHFISYEVYELFNPNNAGQQMLTRDSDAIAVPVCATRK